jgi:DNA replication and repair protein RecF
MNAYLANLRLQSFRNYTALDLSLEPGVSLFVGRNGQGKSNVLEAVCYLALLRSFRTQTAVVLRQWNAAGFSIEGEMGSDDPLARHALSVQSFERRLLRLDGKNIERASDFINQFHCVPLVPEDIELIRGPARERRRFLDILCSQVLPGYLRHLQAHHEAIRSRNAILRAGDSYPVHALEAYDEVLVSHGAQIEQGRKDVSARLNLHLVEVAGRLFTGGKQSLAVEYSSFAGDVDNVDEIAKVYREELSRSRPRDVRQGRTCVGPHLANLGIHLGGRPVARYGSEGECRLTALALRLASLGVIREPAVSDHAVILLVDDVYGELDSPRREAFFQCVSEADQTLITATEHPTELPAEGIRVFHVHAGEIQPQ